MVFDSLDPVDQQLIELLIKNARSSYSELAAQVGLSRVAVKARIDALEKSGIIEEYTTIINPQKISGAVSCYFELQVSPEHLDTVVQRLRESDIVTQLYRMTGRGCLHLHAVASSQSQLEQFILTQIDTLPGIQSIDTHVILSRIKDVKGLRL